MVYTLTDLSVFIFGCEFFSTLFINNSCNAQNRRMDRSNDGVVDFSESFTKVNSLLGIQMIQTLELRTHDALGKNCGNLKTHSTSEWND